MKLIIRLQRHHSRGIVPVANCVPLPVDGPVVSDAAETDDGSDDGVLVLHVFLENLTFF